MAERGSEVIASGREAGALIDALKAEAAAEPATALVAADIEQLGRELAAWAFPGARDAAQVRVRTAHDSAGHEIAGSLLEAAGPDRPFLVDSLLSLCAEQGLEVHALYHPILSLEGGADVSVIQIHLPRLSSDEAATLEREADATLQDVAVSVADYSAMRERMRTEADKLISNTHVDADLRDEAVAFLNWLADERFVFLGARDYRFETGADGKVLPAEPVMVEGSNLGLLRDEDRNVLNRGSEPLVLSAEIGAFLAEPEPLILAKATLRSRVHRRVACDYVGVKHHNETGAVIGETRFLGLYTAEAYNESVTSIPLVRERVARVVEASGASVGSHNEKALSNLLETWPRDELLQADAPTLVPMLTEAVHLIGRPRTRLFVRRDRFNRFVSAIVFVPREAYDTQLRVQMSERLAAAFDGRVTHFQPRFDTSPLARVQFDIELSEKAVSPDLDALERDIAALARTWDDAFREALLSSDLEGEAYDGALCFRGGFNAAYREAFQPRDAIRDVEEMAKLGETAPVRVRAYRHDSDDASTVRAKIYSREASIPLSACVPVFERMGLFVDFETGYPVRPTREPFAGAAGTYWVHSLKMRTREDAPVDLSASARDFEAAFVAIWDGRAESDGFNALIFSAGLDWREAALFRALCAYRHQSGLDPARGTQIRALVSHRALTRELANLFAVRFDPDRDDTLEDRGAQCEDIFARIVADLNSVASLDEDRVIRRLASLIIAIQRTNFYQRSPAGTPLPFISFKIASQELSDLPAPKPFREIFVASPEVEGVHCRFGRVARGGLRWSDRRDDFRTEVLGLVKAQQVKNAVIVPVGSKGGFFPKQIPAGASREQVREAGISAYRTFITAMLDLTGNLLDGKVVFPDRMTVWDGEDPYLVVAADKGTATFSDIANEISLEHGFWLGDAFASGGSAGYDHKKMGITARGAWEAVKRHFREMGKDIQTEPFTVIGCGDMSGDVFGNGMLLSKQIRLQAAFNHMHIFVDPDPQDTERLWQERQRMFDLPRSSWMDYDQSLISEGGGIFDRAAKSIALTPQIKSLTGLEQNDVTPDELIHALLKAPCELLWFGGIGTYAKASTETHGAAGDRGNDGLRVDGRELRARVVGEGANLGLTQAARIEYALNGGRINTDAIDNSAGVDSSDHEVNIKILCSEAIRRGHLPGGERNTLLASMTDDVADHVLAHNYSQTGALSLAAHTARADHEALERLMIYLEGRGVLDREVEGLPDSAEMRERAEAGRWLTRPEIAVLMAWSKITLFDDIVDSDVPDDPYFEDTLRAYFPAALHEFQEAMDAHRLKREIIATVLANRLIDAGGPVFLLRLREQTGASNAAICTAFEAARAFMGAEKLEDEINALDNRVPADLQIAMQGELARALAEAVTAFLKQPHEAGLSELLGPYMRAASELEDCLPRALGRFERARFKSRREAFERKGAPNEVAAGIAAATHYAYLPYLLTLARTEDEDVIEAASAFFETGEALRLAKLRSAALESLGSASYWERLATRRLIDDLLQQQVDAAARGLQASDVETWLDRFQAAHGRLLDELSALLSGKPQFAQFALAGDALRAFMRETADV